MDCIINPITGRAVKINSPAGRRAIKYSTKNNIAKSHDCIINPKTGRAVKKDSAIGRRLMKQFKENENIQTPAPKSKTPAPPQPQPKPKSKTPQPPPKPKSKTPQPPPKPKMKKMDFGAFKTPPRYFDTPPRDTSAPKNMGANEKVKSKRKGVIKSPVAKEATPKAPMIPEPPPKIKTQSPEPPPKSETLASDKSNKKSDSVNIFIDEKDAKIECYTLDCRIKHYNIINEYLEQISRGECLETVKENGRDYYTLQDILMLDKKIGSESKYGSVYLSFIKQERDLYVATKISKKYDFVLKEAGIAYDITEMILQPKYSKHYPFFYSKHICEDTDDKKSFVMVNELANGDLKMLLTDKNFYKSADVLDTLYNLLVQCIISLGTFHKFMNMYHSDAHWGNFLYQRNDEDGFYKYENNKEPFYLASCDYNMMLHDYAFAFSLDDYETRYECISDILNITYAFLPKLGGYQGWSNKMNPFIKSTDPEIKEYLKNVSNIKKDLDQMWSDAFKRGSFMKESYDFDVILDILKRYIPKHILDNKPLKGSLINKKPYLIGLDIHEEFIKRRDRIRKLDADFEKELQDKGFYNMTEQERIEAREKKAGERRGRGMKKPKSKTPKPKSKTPIPPPKPKSKTPIPPPKPKSKTPKPKSKTPKPVAKNSPVNLKKVGEFIQDTEEYLKSKSTRAFNALIKKYDNKEYIADVIGAQMFGDFYPTPQKCLNHAYGDMIDAFAKDDVFIEPTAGLGSIVYWLLNNGIKSKIITTDFDVNLHKYLKTSFENFNNVDIIPHDKSDYLKLENNFVGYKPTVIFLNPPFSKGSDKKYYLNFLYKALYDLKNSKNRYGERQLFFISPQLTKDEKDGSYVDFGSNILSSNKKKEIMDMLNINETELDDLTPTQFIRVKTCNEFAGTNIEAVFYHCVIIAL